jgi:hypothetical protein
MTNEKRHIQFIKDIKAGKRQSPLKAIRLFCLECMGYNAAEVVDCKGDTSEPACCPLYYFRFGRNQTRKAKKLSDKEKKKLSEMAKRNFHAKKTA